MLPKWRKQSFIHSLDHSFGNSRGWLKGNSNFLSFNTIMNMCNPANTQDTKSLGLHLGQAGPQEVSLQITPSLLPV